MLQIIFKNGLRGELIVKQFAAFISVDVEVKIYDKDNYIKTKIIHLLENEYLHLPDDKLGELVDDKIYKKSYIVSFFSPK